MKKTDIATHQAAGTFVAVASYLTRDRLPYAVPARIIETGQPRKVYRGRSYIGHTTDDGVLVEYYDRRTLELQTVEKPIGAPGGLTEPAPRREDVAGRNIIDTWSGYVHRDHAAAVAREQQETRRQNARARKQELVDRTRELLGDEFKYAVSDSGQSDLRISERALEALLAKAES